MTCLVSAVGRVVLCLLVSNQCPTVTLSVDKTSARPGETVTFTAAATDMDDGAGPVTYEWTASQGSLARVSDSEVTLDTTGLTGEVEVSVTVGTRDPDCLRTARVTIDVLPGCGLSPIQKCPPCDFLRNRADVDEACLQILDDVAVRMGADPTTSLVVDGHRDKGERRVVALKRAEAVRDYLVDEKGIDTTRILIRSFENECPKTPSVEIYFLPQGHSGDEIQKDCN